MKNRPTFAIAVDNRGDGSNTFEFISFGLHHHTEDDTSECEFRSGFYFTIFNVRVSVGLMTI